jgi:cytochrome c553
MKKFLKWLGIVAVSFIAIVVVVMIYAYSASEREFARQYKVAETLSVSLPTDAAEIEEGHRLAHITGCTHCHGANLAEPNAIDIPGIARFVPPNISQIVPTTSDAQLVGLLRRGVKIDGTSAWLMPAEMFRHLHDEDVARILAWVRTVPASGEVAGKTSIHLMGRALVAMNQIKPVARQIDEAKGEPAIPPGRGAYLVMNACSECHGQDLNGVPMANAPSLVVVKGYSAEQFARLMHDGVGVGEREFELMTPTAKARFSHLTADEVQAVYEFLQSRFEKT